MQRILAVLLSAAIISPAMGGSGRYTEEQLKRKLYSFENLRSTGVGMLVGGIMGTTVGVALFASGINFTIQSSASYNDDAAAVQYFLGVVLMWRSGFPSVSPGPYSPQSDHGKPASPFACWRTAVSA